MNQSHWKKPKDVEGEMIWKNGLSWRDVYFQTSGRSMYLYPKRRGIKQVLLEIPFIKIDEIIKGTKGFSKNTFRIVLVSGAIEQFKFPANVEQTTIHQWIGNLRHALAFWKDKELRELLKSERHRKVTLEGHNGSSKSDEKKHRVFFTLWNGEMIGLLVHPTWTFTDVYSHLFAFTCKPGACSLCQLRNELCTLWAVDIAGSARRVDKDELLVQLEKSGHSLFLMEHQHKLLVVHFGDYSYEALTTPSEITAKEVLKMDEVSSKLRKLSCFDPSLFLCYDNGKEVQFCMNDNPLNYTEHGKIVARSKRVRVKSLKKTDYRAIAEIRWTEFEKHRQRQKATQAAKECLSEQIKLSSNVDKELCFVDDHFAAGDCRPSRRTAVETYSRAKILPKTCNLANDNADCSSVSSIPCETANARENKNIIYDLKEEEKTPNTFTSDTQHIHNSCDEIAHASNNGKLVVSDPNAHISCSNISSDSEEKRNCLDGKSSNVIATRCGSESSIQSSEHYLKDEDNEDRACDLTSHDVTSDVAPPPASDETLICKNYMNCNVNRNEESSFLDDGSPTDINNDRISRKAESSINIPCSTTSCAGSHDLLGHRVQRSISARPVLKDQGLLRDETLGLQRGMRRSVSDLNVRYSYTCAANCADSIDDNTASSIGSKVMSESDLVDKDDVLRVTDIHLPKVCDEEVIFAIPECDKLTGPTWTFSKRVEKCVRKILDVKLDYSKVETLIADELCLILYELMEHGLKKTIFGLSLFSIGANVWVVCQTVCKVSNVGLKSIEGIKDGSLRQKFHLFIRECIRCKSLSRWFEVLSSEIVQKQIMKYYESNAAVLEPEHSKAMEHMKIYLDALNDLNLKKLKLPNMCHREQQTFLVSIE